METNPYKKLPSDAFWRSAVAQPESKNIRGLWKPKFEITKKMRLVTAGSCFAQHISAAFRTRGYNWYNAEPAPGSAELAHSYHYGVFSFRTGNIYTTRMLDQWFRWAQSPQDCPDVFWSDNGRVFDPFRPTIELDGFASVAEARASRRATLAAIADAMRKADVFVYTLGLTECWRDAETGVEYALCPGTVAGRFDPDLHIFHNMDYHDVMTDLNRALTSLRRVNKNVRVLLTVSPVPLTATASGQHVLTASSLSKSTLRTVAGELCAREDYIDYFPSYEIITHPVFGGKFYDANRRSVSAAGVDFVMRNFFDDLTGTKSHETVPEPPEADEDENDVNNELIDLHCEEEMLAAFMNERD